MSDKTIGGERQRYISANALEKFVSEARRRLPKESRDFFTRDEMLLNFEQYIHLQPTADVRENKTSEWISVEASPKPNGKQRGLIMRDNLDTRIDRILRDKSFNDLPYEQRKTICKHLSYTKILTLWQILHGNYQDLICPAYRKKIRAWLKNCVDDYEKEYGTQPQTGETR